MPDAPSNFSWLIVNEIAGCGFPRQVSEFQWLKIQGIKHILCLERVARINPIYVRFIYLTLISIIHRNNVHTFLRQEFVQVVSVLTFSKFYPDCIQMLARYSHYDTAL